jgi:hypothetical protein
MANNLAKHKTLGQAINKQSEGFVYQLYAEGGIQKSNKKNII